MFNTNYQGSYSAIPTNEAKRSVTLDNALQTWEDRDEIKYQQPQEGYQGYYYSDSQQPEGLLENGRRFFAHLADPAARALHSQSIDKIVSELGTHATHAARASKAEGDLKLREFLGQLPTVGALKKSLEQVSATSISYKPSFSSSFSFPISVFGNPRERGKKPSASLLRSLSLTSLFSNKNGYQQIPEADSNSSSSSLRTTSNISSFSYQHHDEEEISPLILKNSPLTTQQLQQNQTASRHQNISHLYKNSRNPLQKKIYQYSQEINDNNNNC